MREEVFNEFLFSSFYMSALGGFSLYIVKILLYNQEKKKEPCYSIFKWLISEAVSSFQTRHALEFSAVDPQPVGASGVRFACRVLGWDAVQPGSPSPRHVSAE